MGIIVKNDLSRFLNKIKKYSKPNLNNKIGEILERLCKLGEDYARSLYNASEITIEWGYTNSEKTKATITASGTKIAYLEFGTGERGRGSYEGNLPTQDISFYSNAYQQDVTVNGWTYSYAHELGLSDKKVAGFSAQAQMWKTAQYLRTQFVKIAREVVKS